MTTCIIILAVVTCTNVRPLPPARAVAIFTTAVRPFVPSPPLLTPWERDRPPVAPNPNWPFDGPNRYVRPAPLSADGPITVYLPASSLGRRSQGRRR